MDNLSEFLIEVDEKLGSIPTRHRDAQVAAMIDAYEFVVAHSPVDTGTFRASHMIVVGGDEFGHGGTVIFEAPNRPDPNVRPVRGRTPLRPPSVSAAAAALARVEPFQRTSVVNPVLHADMLEYGTAMTPPIRLYGRAEDGLRADLGVARPE